jgi:D,D-heptose 1,7-bisphosphate phosphatase
MSNTAVFFDRDGTLIHDPGYLNHPDQVQVVDGVAEALKEFQVLGYKTVVASNQSGVARGIVTVEMLERIHDRLRELLAVKGATLDAIYYCPYHPDGVVPEYTQDSDWQKPQPGMLLAAAQEMDLDLTRSSRRLQDHPHQLGTLGGGSPARKQAGFPGGEPPRSGEHRQAPPPHGSGSADHTRVRDR